MTKTEGGAVADWTSSSRPPPTSSAPTGQAPRTPRRPSESQVSCDWLPPRPRSPSTHPGSGPWTIPAHHRGTGPAQWKGLPSILPGTPAGSASRRRSASRERWLKVRDNQTPTIGTSGLDPGPLLPKSIPGLALRELPKLGQEGGSAAHLVGGVGYPRDPGTSWPGDLGHVTRGP